MTTITGHTTRANGTILTAAIYNFDHVNHIGNANNLNVGKIEGATPPVVDGHAVVFNGTTGSQVRTGGAAPLLSTVLPLSVANGGTGQTTIGAAAAQMAANGAGFGPLTAIPAAATVDLGTAPSHHVDITGTATITSFGSSANVNTPIYLVRFAAACTIPNSANIAVLGGDTIATAPGDRALMQYIGAGVWRMIDYMFVNPFPAIPAVNNLTITNNGATPNTQLDISWGFANLSNAANAGDLIGPGSVTLNAANIGVVNGLDAGALAASTWYHVYIISNGAALSGTLLSLSSTAPTMPAGYTYRYRVGAVRTSGASQFLRTLQRGNRTVYRVVAGSNTASPPSMATGVAGANTALSISNFVPPTATAIHGTVVMANATATVLAEPNIDYGGAFSNTNPAPVWSSARGSQAFDFLIETTNIYWESGDATGGIVCNGWKDAVNAN